MAGTPEGRNLGMLPYGGNLEPSPWGNKAWVDNVLPGCGALPAGAATDLAEAQRTGIIGTPIEVDPGAANGPATDPLANFR